MDWRLETVIGLLLACGIALAIAANFFTVFPFDLPTTHELQEIENPQFAALM
jgi:hypothetical protein